MHIVGPFINDALAGVGKASSGEVTRLSEYCTSQSQEIEADIVSARSEPPRHSLPHFPLLPLFTDLTPCTYRLLSHAGFDPRHAVRFWEGRQETPQNAECSPTRAEGHYEDTLESLPNRWMGETHPVNVVRVQRLKAELDRWEKVRQHALQERRRTAVASAGAPT